MTDNNISAAFLPASDYEFVDVMDIFKQAAEEMEPTDMYFMEGFGLLEAMSAIEIGEPRLDTGFVNDDENPSAFDPLTPMLPEEICWILDRAFACEAGWHTGRLLSHTVFTLTYIHELPNMEVDLSSSSFSPIDPLRPMELVTAVLRPAVQGLLKCCDLAWRELSTGAMLDGEDWQGDKCEVSLLEGIPTTAIISRLNEAASWILRSKKIPERWRHPLRTRILLRKALLQLMESQGCTDPARFIMFIDDARECLAFVRSNPALELKQSSPARRAFDPMIVRRLSTAVPANRIAELDVDQAWDVLVSLLDDLHDLSNLTKTLSFTSWEIAGSIRVWSSRPRCQTPYSRSLAQKTLYNGVLVLHHFPFKWLMDRFFFESLCVSYESILRGINDRWSKAASPPIQNMERILFTLLSPHIRNHWANGPRRRRYLMKSLVAWHRLCDLLLDVTSSLKPEDKPKDDILRFLPTTALLWRLSVVQEVVFSGFQLELYSPEEIPFAYWYAAQVIEVRLECLDHLIPVVPKSSLTYQEYEFQRQFLTALQLMTMSTFIASVSMMSCDWNAMRPNHYKRYKWAYKPEYDGIKAFPVASPNFHRFIHVCEEIAHDETLEISPGDMIKLAKVIFKQMLQVGSLGGWAGSWTKDRTQFVRQTLFACEALAAMPASSDEMEIFDIGLLKEAEEVVFKTRLTSRPSPYHKAVILLEPDIAGTPDIRRPLTRSRKTVPTTEIADLEDAVHRKERTTVPKRKSIKTALDKPHPAPENWRTVYDTIKDMRSRVVAPVDTMGCDQAQFKESDPKNSRFATLVSLMLSSQTKDEVTDAAVAQLRKTLGGSLSVAAMIEADETAITSAIGKVGFWRRKTGYLKKTALRLRDEFDSDVPKTVDELCSLPGVGPKMAFLALQVAWNLNVGIGVDVHVHRISNRLGWHKPPTKTPEETRLNLQSWLPTELHPEINHLLVGFGQTICLPTRPRCETCLLSENYLCPSAKKTASSPSKQSKVSKIEITLTDTRD
ncbi:hypothetical protein APHAL10511_007152 [Amanita phalloides]|nr:hypothetical protein APHAL10511_007152 [Amanita phalloides]